MTTHSTLRQAKILVVDDEISNIRLLELTLHEAGYTNVFGISDPRETVSLFEGIKPDLLLLDLNMPHLDGIAVIRGLKEQLAISAVPILVLTADATSAAKYQALEEGATDFLTKPFDAREVLLRIGNMLRARFYNVLLEQTVQERTKDLELAQLETVQRLAIAAEYRDDQTGMHANRVGIVSGLIAQTMGFTPSEVEVMVQAAALHDVGKIGISDVILRKPGKLTTEEFEVMKEHTKIGARILSGSTSPVLKLAEGIALSHHERWDGTGYWGLKGEEIPLSGRIVSVADVFDAMTHQRPYKEAFPCVVALEEIRSQSGKQFDPRAVEAFLSLSHEHLVNFPTELPGRIQHMPKGQTFFPFS
ncbi:HD domain-containing phosphohydrolase [Fimbriimonas ginsengisoli]|uniref:Response regulator receiver modulated metal dependent phosphohydrolase n=1 Tax=Fimbriimonas ginsengisoli Gsoil 348 TaxID=661478 RepID=A0A068NRL5_FIMGI|nr:HD domain-containing phosphohydrolase [Fimbriimonas ginsengisoli]AIE86007.1 response regulator receiver modulated metal dependent phosphohydrolase [Fimbriimonas ginsengisoli Gsoil 348]